MPRPSKERLKLFEVKETLLKEVGELEKEMGKIFAQAEIKKAVIENLDKILENGDE